MHCMSSRPAIPISCFRCSSRGATESRHPSFDANPFQTKRSPSFKRRPFSKQHSRMSSSVPHCFTRQHITMPRRLRKRNVYEEVARLLDIPGGKQIVKERYAQMRKFNCWNISIVQQYGRFKESRIRSAVFGNSRQFFLMRQNDRSDLDDMAADIGLTELTKHAILSYPLPDQQKGEKFAAFTYLHNDAQNPICGTAHNVASPEMLYISGSSGAQFDQRAEALRGSNDVVATIAA